jgi:hypothetical protein
MSRDALQIPSIINLKVEELAPGVGGDIMAGCNYSYREYVLDSRSLDVLIAKKNCIVKYVKKIVS